MQYVCLDKEKEFNSKECMLSICFSFLENKYFTYSTKFKLVAITYLLIVSIIDFEFKESL